MKAFLSHSSKQKDYVEQVASILGKDKVNYDSWSFDAGGKTLDEIYTGIENSGVFVFFISTDSLSSEWVKKELIEAENFIKSNSYKKFIPILIDSSITHKSPLIPEWMKESYNIKLINKPQKAAKFIKEKILSAIADKIPTNNEEKQLFIGRNEEKAFFEKELYPADGERPFSLLVSGLPNIGKKKFIKKVLTDTHIIEKYYYPIQISLDRRKSIEDFILQLFDQYSSEKDVSYVENLLSKTVNEKIEICYNLILELFKNDEIIMIIDDHCIFSKRGECVEWFIELMRKLKLSLQTTDIKICVATKTKIRNTWKDFGDGLINITLPEFAPHERKLYLERLIKIHGIELSESDTKDLLKICTGIPKQIRIIVKLLEMDANIPEIIKNAVDFNNDYLKKLLEEYEHKNDKLALQLLKFLSMGEIFSKTLIYSVFKKEYSDIEKLLISFENELLIEPIVKGEEYIKLTDSTRDYIERLNFELNQEYKAIIRKQAEKYFQNLSIDRSSEVFYSRQSLKMDMEIPLRYAIPSLYLNAMRDLYNYDKKYSFVVKLAEKILLYENNLDKKIIDEVLYWYCLSLARLRNPSLLRVVQKINGVEHNFILGFYYRLTNRSDKAIENLLLTLENDPNHFRAKRELVQVYINTEQYDKAYGLAKSNYESDPSNPYYIQSYFKCIIRDDKLLSSDKEKILYTLLDALKSSQHEKAKEMFGTSTAQFIAYVQKDYSKALLEINDCINAFPDAIYPYLVELEIIKNNVKIDYNNLNSSILKIEQKFDKGSDIFNKLIFVFCKIMVLKSYELNDASAQTYFLKVKGNFPEKVISDIENYLKKCE